MTRTEFDLEQYDKLVKGACFVCRIVGGDPLVPGVKVIDQDDFSITFLNQFPTQEGLYVGLPETAR